MGNAFDNFLRRFFEAVCMKSAFLIQRPTVLFIHSDSGPPQGRHWDQLLEIPGFREAIQVTTSAFQSRIFFFRSPKCRYQLKYLVLSSFGTLTKLMS